jgi:CheY-like chemotaxis protein
MPRGGRLRIVTENLRLAHDARGLPAGEYVAMTVSDTGTGMSPEVLERAVQPFFTTKEVGKGSGLGLSTIYGFTEQSGGKLEIESRVGAGTAVRVILPRAQDAETATRDVGALRSIPRGSETILVVEDDVAVRGLAVAQLAELGYQTLQARDGVAALDLLERAPHVDLVFTDLMMPGGLSGLDLAGQARERRPDVKVLLTSGYSEEVVGPLDILGPYPFLRKPYRRRDLALKVREALDAPAAATPAKT